MTAGSITASTPLQRPDFILIGAGKSGTTAFHQMLSRHPSIFCSIPKEPNFFAYPDMQTRIQGASHSQDIKSVEAYRALFNDAQPSQICGEASVGYLPQINTPAHVHRHLPHVKLIAILRHPVDRAYSSWLHRRNDFNEPQDFPTACKLGPQRVADGWDWYWDYLNTGYYARHLRRWFSFFPQHQFKVFLYEDWLSAPTQVLNDTCDFLGVPPCDFNRIEKHNVTSIGSRSKWLHSMLNPSRGLRKLVQRTFPNPLRRSIIRGLRVINRRPSPTLDPALRTRMTEPFHDDIADLEKILNRDLSFWRQHT